MNSFSHTNSMRMKLRSRFENCYIPGAIEKVKWEIHKLDKDKVFPSVPHLHAIENNWKMDIYTGDIFEGKLKIKKLTRKKLKYIWSIPVFVSIVHEERERYEKMREQDPERFPPLPQIPTSKKYKYCAMVGMSVRKIRINHFRHPPTHLI